MVALSIAQKNFGYDRLEWRNKVDAPKPTLLKQSFNNDEYNNGLPV